MENYLCETNQITLKDVRVAMTKGARTVEDAISMANICGNCSCVEETKQVLSLLCRCKKVPMDTVISAINNGADTVEKIMEETTAGTGCGRCQKIIENVLTLGK